MIYRSYALNTLVILVFAFELHENSNERQSLSLLIKSHDLAEFVRAEQRLAKPLAEEDKPTPPAVELEDADPEAVLMSLGDQTKS